MAKAFKQRVRSALKPISAAADLVRRPIGGLTILIYHRVGANSGGEVDLDTAVFDEQMAMIAAAGRAVSLDDGVAWLAGAEVGTNAPVVVTFDDGTPDVYEHALPILERHRVPMTLYLATQHIDEQRGFWSPSDAPLSWATIADGQSTGLITIGSHTHSHALLDRLPPAELDAELDRSVALIEDNLDLTPKHFAYPKALAPSPEAAAAVKARFVSAALARTRPNRRGADAMALTRSPVQRSDGMRWFAKKLDGGMGFEDDLRTSINKRRYAKATR